MARIAVAYGAIHVNKFAVSIMLHMSTYHSNDHTENDCPSRVSLESDCTLMLHLPKQIQVYQ